MEMDTLILNAQEAAALVSLTHAEIEAEPQRARATARCRQMIITPSNRGSRRKKVELGGPEPAH